MKNAPEENAGAAGRSTRRGLVSQGSLSSPVIVDDPESLARKIKQEKKAQADAALCREREAAAKALEIQSNGNGNGNGAVELGDVSVENPANSTLG